VNRGESSDLLLYRFHRNRPVALKQKTMIFPTLSCCLTAFLFFSFGDSVASAIAEVGAGADLRSEFEKCSLCSLGGKCVLNSSLQAQYKHYQSGITTFHCECNEGRSGALCEHEAAARANANDGQDYGIGNDDGCNDNACKFRDLSTEGCAFECQNEGTCISVLGGMSYACICPEPFWGTLCEFDGSKEPCDLDCSSIITDGSFEPKGGFCVESPQTLDEYDDTQACVSCQELPEEKDLCENQINCLNGGDCKVKYLFVDAGTEGNEAPTDRSWQCYSSDSMTQEGSDGIVSRSHYWMEIPTYALYCECPKGFQGEFCEEIEVCGGCQNDGYCVSEHSPIGDDFFNFNPLASTGDNDDHTSTNVYIGVHDDFTHDAPGDRIFNLSFDFDDDFLSDNDLFNFSFSDDDNLFNFSFDFDDNELFGEDDDFLNSTGEVHCTCLFGGCDQSKCGHGAACFGGSCNQNGLIGPTCWSGKCTQRNTTDASCFGGGCDQTNAVGSSCFRKDCFRDESNDLSQPFCKCKYGYFGDHCQYLITTLCMLDGSGNSLQGMHEFCLRVNEFCFLPDTNMFCANEGTCGNFRSVPSVTQQIGNEPFSCDCPSGFEGVHCESPITEAPSLRPSNQPTSMAPVQITSSPPTNPSSAVLPRTCWHSLVFVVPFAALYFY